jgi:serine/threonine-protein kinase HipA
MKSNRQRIGVRNRRGRDIGAGKVVDEDTCDLDLVLASAEYFGISQMLAKTIIKEVGTATSKWREIAQATGAKSAEIQRMQSAFEHTDL